MDNIWFVAATWMGLAFAASLISIKLGISVSLIEIVLGAIAGNFFNLHPSDWITFLASFGSVVLPSRAGAELVPPSMLTSTSAFSLLAVCRRELRLA